MIATHANKKCIISLGIIMKDKTIMETFITNTIVVYQIKQFMFLEQKHCAAVFISCDVQIFLDFDPVSTCLIFHIYNIYFPSKFNQSRWK